MSAPLAGVRVLDLGHHVAGPLTALLLADQGADVVRVARPGAAAADPFLDRGKRRVELDLKAPDGLAAARALAAEADVLVENFRPGVTDRLGLGWAQLRAANRGLVYCAIPGFGAADPRAGVQGWEGVIAAATGNCRPRAGNAPPGWDPDRPTYTAVPVASNFAAFCSAVAIVAALTERHRTGLGDRLEISLYAAMFEAIGGSGAYPVATGLPPERAISTLGSGCYRCADGRYVQFNPIGATNRFLRWFLDAAGVGHWIGEGLADRARSAADPGPLRARLTGLFASRPAAEWEELAATAGTPLAAVRTTVEWMGSEQAVADRQAVSVIDPIRGPLTVPGAAVVFDGTPDPTGRAAPAAAADPGEVLAGWRRPTGEQVRAGTPAPPAADTADGPYAGLRVLDLTQILAGPSAGRVLAEFGADVTKINVPQRRIGAHGVVNRGKRTMLLDVTSEAGEQVLWQLIEQSDVVTHNLPAGTAQRYGLSHEQLTSRRPELVHVSVSCYGGSGPWAGRRGYETQGQAATGLAERTGGTHGPAVLGPYNVLDYGTGMLAAFAVALGVYRRAGTGRGGAGHVSLTRTGVYHQARYAVSTAPGDEPRGPEALGLRPGHRFHRASDRWLFVAATPGQEDRLTALLGTGPDGRPGTFGGRTATDWVRLLGESGVAAHEVVGLAELMTDPRARGQGLSITQISEEVGEVVMPGPVVRAERIPVGPGPAARRPGADGRDVLTAAGLADRISELERSWVVQLDALPTGWAHF
ncbi:MULTISPECIES: CaiB/BaiF CoA-transferase family protein [Pseudonocardia]|uniref:Formyl-coenzyme A transferase n=2 Tax=Pseudonocardia TaxID=1847 RepID=A0A1Y2MKE4_PSEAH|nr:MULTISPECIES: CoA transferase [Pseudonocardia]OSY35735.1 Formyl-coenzyme A transferase [Pseudonocardia autotrophica]TDN74573.1 dimethylsulfoniopropionate cleavage enzyme DddD [Pseudonocardia autotrophica]BBG05341.1 CoA transferase [Pseudonocardia autotrophica]GEC27465.1 CoA transferase [Pseudonocardia saturnea]